MFQFGALIHVEMILSPIKVILKDLLILFYLDKKHLQLAASHILAKMKSRKLYLKQAKLRFWGPSCPKLRRGAVKVMSIFC